MIRLPTTSQCRHNPACFTVKNLVIPSRPLQHGRQETIVAGAERRNRIGDVVHDDASRILIALRNETTWAEKIRMKEMHIARI